MGAEATEEQPVVAQARRFVEALRVLRPEKLAYRQRLRRLEEGESTSLDAYCAALRARAQGLFPKGLGWADLIAEAERLGQASGLVYVLAAEAALQAGEAEAAVGWAGAAVGLDQLDTRAQGLFVRASAASQGQERGGEDDLKGFFCARPFEDFEIRHDGAVYTCCATWLPVPIGNINEDAPDALWNSAAAQAIRGSILDGSYRYCSRMLCPHLVDRRLPRRDRLRRPEHREIVEQGLTRLPRGPRRVLMSQDRSCNLSCPSCRAAPILARKEEQDRLNQLAESTIFPLLRDARKVKVTGSGDPFASSHFRYVLKRINRVEFPALDVELQTNGLLLDRRAWEELGLEGSVVSIWVSIDAAQPSSYARLRRGGDLDRLLENLAFMAELRQAGRIQLLRLDCVVQGANYQELPAIVEIGRAFGCDIVHFQLLRNWGTYRPDEFRRHFIASPDHPEFGDFQAVLRHPNMSLRLVDLGELAPMRERALAAGR